jgi:elongator complex protein 1
MQNLQEMPLLRRKLAIDNDLKRYEKALNHLYNLDVFNEFKEFTQKHELYSQGIELYKYRTEKLNELMRLYADFLNGQRSFRKAGIGKTVTINH